MWSVNYMLQTCNGNDLCSLTVMMCNGNDETIINLIESMIHRILSYYRVGYVCFIRHHISKYIKQFRSTGLKGFKSRPML